MFSNTLRTSIPYAQQLQNQRIRLALPSQSALGVLMTYSSADNPQANEPIEMFLGRIDNVTVVQGSLTEHDHAMCTLVDELIPLTESHIRMSRHIGQLATELANNVRRYVESAPAIDASGEFNIVKDETAGLFDEPSVISLIGQASTAPIRNVGSNFCSGARSFDALLGYLVTGNAKLDLRVKEIVAGYDSNWLENIWYGLFATGSGLASAYSLGALGTLPTGERLAVSYVAYVIAGKLLHEVPEDSVGGLSKYEDGLADLRDQMLVIMSGALSEYQHQLKNKVLAVAYRGYNRSVIVNGPVYREWLENGGSPELMLGSLLSNNPAYTAEEFSARGDQFKRQWDGFCVLHNADSDLRRSVFLRSIYLTCFGEALGNIAPFEEAFRKQNPNFAEQAMSRAEAYLCSSGITALVDLETVCLELMAGIRFDYTPAKMILQDIDAVMKSTPNADIREAALVAAANYLALYLVGQMSVGVA